MFNKLSAVVGVLSVLIASSAHATSVSYDATSGVPASPNFSLINFTGASTSASGGVLSVGPTSKGTLSYTFYANTNQMLDHNQTIDITANARAVTDDSDNTTDRAGFALALTDDRNFYNELYITPTEVFLNKLSTDGTTRVRDSAFTLPDSGFHAYDMMIQNGAITVSIDGVQRLTGSMFDTSTLTGIPTSANWAVFGDITSSAGGTFELKSYSVSVVPEPGCLASTALIGLLLTRRRRTA